MKNKGIGFMFVLIGKILLVILICILLELNHNTLWGWFLFLALSVGYFYLSYRNIFSHPFLLTLLFLLCSILIFLLSWPPVKAVPAVADANPDKTDIIHLKEGDLRGVFNKDHSVEVYAGIPYAKPPIGDLRWKAPEDPEPWQGILEADHFAPMSMQTVSLPLIDSLTKIIGYHDYRISLSDHYRPPVSEDSLYLNIWKPCGKEEKLPVLVYIHGGSLQTGQTWYGDYNGESIAKEGVVVVNFAYRLGVFGFFADEQLIQESPYGSSGNYGLMDMIKALEWVKEHISYFGGDPENITLAGESAGSAAVSALCTSPLTKGLFTRVVMESSTLASIAPPHSYRSLQDALSSGKQLKERYLVSSIDELRKLPADQLVKEADSQHHITVDGYVLLEDPYLSYRKGIHNEEAIFHGYNQEESGPFILFSQADLKNYEQKVYSFFHEYTDRVIELFPAQSDEQARENWAIIYGSVFFNYPHYCLNRLANENQIPVYEYRFTKKNGRLGCWHSGEEVYLYGNIPDHSSLYDESDRYLSSIMKGHLLSYIRTGDPNTEGLPAFPINQDAETLLEYGNEIKVIPESLVKLYAILDDMYGWKNERS